MLKYAIFTSTLPLSVSVRWLSFSPLGSVSNVTSRSLQSITKLHETENTSSFLSAWHFRQRRQLQRELLTSWAAAPRHLANMTHVWFRQVLLAHSLLWALNWTDLLILCDIMSFINNQAMMLSTAHAQTRTLVLITSHLWHWHTHTNTRYFYCGS